MAAPELVFALVGAVGTDLSGVADVLSTQLSRVGYNSRTIKVSALLCQLEKFKKLSTQKFKTDFERLDKLMDAGTALRKDTQRGDILALLSIAELRHLREQHGGKHAGDAQERVAYILQSLKHPDEIQTLRDVYGRAFFVVSANAPRTTRVDRLARRIASSACDPDASRFRDKAEFLVNRDEDEQEPFGQNVRDSFPQADVFVDATSASSLERSLSRFVELLFGHPFHTPTRDEYAMFHATSAALRSADLGRQVGVAIANSCGDIIAVGCNEVPQALGGLYWADSNPDGRDFQRGHDSNFDLKKKLVEQVVDLIRKDAGSERSSSTIATQIAATQAFKQTIAANIIEYGRAVHAEMAAISDAARRGVSIQDAILYTTTFPCHLCARHIVASGIRRVVYIEPYAKSQVTQLYDDSIVVDPVDPVVDRVEFRSFVGIAPSIYFFMFRPALPRKSSAGRAIPWLAGQARPRLKRFVLSYLMIEDRVLAEELPAALEAAGLKIAT